MRSGNMPAEQASYAVPSLGWNRATVASSSPTISRSLSSSITSAEITPLTFGGLKVNHATIPAEERGSSSTQAYIFASAI